MTETTNVFDAVAVAAEAARCGVDPVATVVFQAMGAASMCWEMPAAAGVFESTRARVIGDEVVDWLRPQLEGRRVEPLAAEQRLVLRLSSPVVMDAEEVRRLKGALVDGRVLVVDEDVEVHVVDRSQLVVAWADVYVAGPMSGLEEFNYPVFAAAQAELEAAGLVVESPTQGGQVEGWGWSDYMRRGIAQLLRCGGVATLPGWEGSRGAMVEVGLALSLGMRVAPVADWVAEQQ